MARSNKYILLPLLAGFFVMGFGDIIGTVMNQVKAECAALTPVFVYLTATALGNWKKLKLED